MSYISSFHPLNIPSEYENFATYSTILSGLASSDQENCLKTKSNGKFKGISRVNRLWKNTKSYLFGIPNKAKKEAVILNLMKLFTHGAKNNWIGLSQLGAIRIIMRKYFGSDKNLANKSQELTELVQDIDKLVKGNRVSGPIEQHLVSYYNKNGLLLEPKNIFERAQSFCCPCTVMTDFEPYILPKVSDNRTITVPTIVLKPVETPIIEKPFEEPVAIEPSKPAVAVDVNNPGNSAHTSPVTTSLTEPKLEISPVVVLPSVTPSVENSTKIQDKDSAVNTISSESISEELKEISIPIVNYPNKTHWTQVMLDIGKVALPVMAGAAGIYYLFSQSSSVNPGILGESGNNPFTDNQIKPEIPLVAYPLSFDRAKYTDLTYVKREVIFPSPNPSEMGLKYFMDKPLLRQIGVEPFNQERIFNQNSPVESIYPNILRDSFPLQNNTNGTFVQNTSDGISIRNNTSSVFNPNDFDNIPSNKSSWWSILNVTFLGVTGLFAVIFKYRLNNKINELEALNTDLVNARNEIEKLTKKISEHEKAIKEASEIASKKIADLEEAIKKQNDIIGTHDVEIFKHKSINQDLELRLKESNEKLVSLHRELTNESQRVRELEDRLKQSLQKTGDLENAIELNNATIAKLRDELREKTGRISELESQLIECGERNKALENELAERNKKIEELENEVIDFKKKVFILEEELIKEKDEKKLIVDKLNLKIKNLELALEKAHEFAGEASQEKIKATAKIKLNDKTAELLKNRQDEILNLKNQISDFQKKINKLEAEKNKAQEKCRTFEVEINSFVLKIKATETTTEENQKKIDELQKENECLRKQLEEEQKSSNELKEQLNENEKEISALKNKNGKLIEENQKLNLLVDEKLKIEKRIEKLEQKLEIKKRSKNEKIKNLLQNLIKSEESYKKLVKDLQSNLECLEELNESLKNKDAEILRLTEKVSEYEKEINSLKIQIEELTEKLSESEKIGKDVETLSAMLSALQGKLIDIEAKKSATEEQLKGLLIRIEELEKEKKENEEKLNSISENYALKIKSLEEQISEYENEINLLTEQNKLLAEKALTSDQDKEKIERLNNEIEILRRQLNETNSKKDDALKLLERVKTSKKKLKELLAKSNAKVSFLEAMMDKEIIIPELQEKYRILVENVKSIFEVIEKLNYEVAVFKEFALEGDSIQSIVMSMITNSNSYLEMIKNNLISNIELAGQIKDKEEAMRKNEEVESNNSKEKEEERNKKKQSALDKTRASIDDNAKFLNECVKKFAVQLNESTKSYYDSILKSLDKLFKENEINLTVDEKYFNNSDGRLTDSDYKEYIVNLLSQLDSEIKQLKKGNVIKDENYDVDELKVLCDSFIERLKNIIALYGIEIEIEKPDLNSDLSVKEFVDKINNYIEYLFEILNSKIKSLNDDSSNLEELKKIVHDCVKSELCEIKQVITKRFGNTGNDIVEIAQSKMNEPNEFYYTGNTNDLNNFDDFISVKYNEPVPDIQDSLKNFAEEIKKLLSTLYQTFSPLERDEGTLDKEEVMGKTLEIDYKQLQNKLEEALKEKEELIKETKELKNQNLETQKKLESQKEEYKINLSNIGLEHKEKSKKIDEELAIEQEKVEVRNAKIEAKDKEIKKLKKQIEELKATLGNKSSSPQKVYQKRSPTENLKNEFAKKESEWLAEEEAIKEENNGLRRILMDKINEQQEQQVEIEELKKRLINVNVEKNRIEDDNRQQIEDLNKVLEKKKAKNDRRKERAKELLSELESIKNNFEKLENAIKRDPDLKEKINSLLDQAEVFMFV